MSVFARLYNYCIDLLQARQNEAAAGPATGPSRAPPPNALMPAGRSSNVPMAVDSAVRRLRQAWYAMGPTWGGGGEMPPTDRLRPLHLCATYPSCHPQVGEQNRSIFGQETRTMEQVLSVLRRQSYSELGNLRRQVLGLRCVPRGICAALSLVAAGLTGAASDRPALEAVAQCKARHDAGTGEGL